PTFRPLSSSQPNPYTLAVLSGTGLNEAADAAVERSPEVDARAPGDARGVAGVASGETQSDASVVTASRPWKSGTLTGIVCSHRTTRCHPSVHKKSINFNELAGKTICQPQSQRRKSLQSRLAIQSGSLSFPSSRTVDAGWTVNEPPA